MILLIRTILSPVGTVAAAKGKDKVMSFVSLTTRYRLTIVKLLSDWNAKAGGEESGSCSPVEYIGDAVFASGASFIADDAAKGSVRSNSGHLHWTIRGDLGQWRRQLLLERKQFVAYWGTRDV